MNQKDDNDDHDDDKRNHSRTRKTVVGDCNRV